MFKDGQHSLFGGASFAIFQLLDWQTTGQWLEQNGETLLNTTGTVFMWTAAAHAAYLTTVPKTLRVAVSRKNQRLWQGLSAGALGAVAVYDTLCSSCVSSQQQRLNRDTKNLRATLRDLGDV